ncbi:transcriptional regulator, AraC family [Amphibacillus marinus]|uniref:Transcriptional regulator, AraC family n=1 Tax=Amphibacillus marinus TaxID=872970 RepID=A0A1H8GN06_9BACI|nr:AraC family transcriptional regulator [Amphibacillus marinus]SEN45521.1 transcriptional regulator, AraC family [Amphibacillus marinus]
MIELEKHHYGENLAVVQFHPESLTYPEHLHRSFELVICREGSCLLSIEQTLFQLKKNELALILPFQSHFIKTVAYSQLDILIFSPEYIDDFYTKVEDLAFDNPVISLADNLLATLQEPLFNTDSSYHRKSGLYHILYLFEQQRQLIYAKSHQGLTAQMLIYIDQHFQENLTIEQLSTALGYSEAYVSKLIARHLNSTFPRLVNNVRINHACFLLAQSQDSITTISDRCGFQNVRTFNRNFKTIMGMTPKQYRQTITIANPN